jgi:hypothetical protein
LPSESTTQIAASPPDQLSSPDSAVHANSPVAYGLGFFGLTSTTQALAGFFLFFYVDVLGLAVALAAVINIIYVSYINTSCISLTD